MDTDSFLFDLKTEDVYKDIVNNVKPRFDTLNYEVARLLQKAIKKKVIAVMKDELGRKIMTKFVGLGTKTYSYLKDDGKKSSFHQKSPFCSQDTEMFVFCSLLFHTFQIQKDKWKWKICNVMN